MLLNKNTYNQYSYLLKYLGAFLFGCLVLVYVSSILRAPTNQLRQKSGDLHFLINEAESTQKRMIAIISAMDDNYIVIDPGIKGADTINQLLSTRWNGDPSYITDFSRAAIIVNNFFEVYRCLDNIGKSLEIVNVSDNFFSPYPEGYRDVNIVFKDPVNNHLGEIQINTKANQDYKNKRGYKIFDSMRTIKAKAHLEKRELTSQEREEIDNLILESSIGYNQSLGDSMKVGDKFLRVGVYGILIRDNQVLMVRTQSGSRSIYNFPGGGVDHGEGLAQALLRECKEEIGADVIIQDRVYTAKELYINEDFPDSYMFNLYYKIKLKENESINGVDAKWFPVSSLPIDEMLSIDKEFASEILQGNSKLMPIT